jgi:hypothetical protein
MGLIEQRSGAAEGAVCRKTGDDQEDNCNRHNGSSYQEDGTPRASGMLSDAASMSMLLSSTVLFPVARSVAVRMGAALPAVPVRGQLGA